MNWFSKKGQLIEIVLENRFNCAFGEIIATHSLQNMECGDKDNSLYIIVRIIKRRKSFASFKLVVPNSKKLFWQLPTTNLILVKK